MKGMWKKAFSLFWYFFRIGWFTFGGGWSLVAAIQKKYAEEEKVIGSEELLDIVSVGRSLPGTMIGNVAYLFGYHMAGVPGGVLSVLGIVLPPLIILSFVTLAYSMVRDSVIIARAMIGVRSIVPVIILSAVLKLHKGAFKEKLCYVICAAGLVLSLLKFSSIVVVLLGAACGLAMHLRKEKAA